MPVEIGWKRNRREAVRGGKIERRAVAGCEQFFLACAAALPHRTDGVDECFAGSR